MKTDNGAAESSRAAELRKPRFRRQRTREIAVVEEVQTGGRWVARTPENRRRRGAIRFRVTGLYIGGKRVRRYFGTRAEAETFMETQEARKDNLGLRAEHVDGRLLEEAVEAESLLEVHGLRLLDAVKDFLAAREALEGFPDVRLREAAEHYCDLLVERDRSWTVDEAVEVWLESRKAKNRSKLYITDATNRLRRFQDTFGSRCLADITTAEIDAWINGLSKTKGQEGKKRPEPMSAQSVRNYLTVLSALFSYAVKQGKSPRNPAKDVERPDVVRDEPGILTPDQLAGLLKHLQRDAIPLVTISAFAGLRPMEVRRLDWTDINFATGMITVKPGKAKTKRRRTVPIPPNLRAWLEPLALEFGPVVTLADATVYQKRLRPAMAKAKITAWPHDCLRHSAATYLLAKESDAAKVALWLGHDVDTLHAHYKGLLADPKHAAQWFEINPPTDFTKVIPIRKAAS